ncbi:MAG: type II secretion system F family protein [Candidatus Omnitrophica bacterium]|nr:type II secretion system F family protein [Candidatus Omnitrophota bacterium]
MVFIILILFLGSIGYLAYVSIPVGTDKYSKLQKKRMDTTASGLDRLFMANQGRKMLPFFTISPVVLALAGYVLLRKFPLIGIGAGLAVGFIIPAAIMKNLAFRRRMKFQGQLVDALMILSSALKAGMSLNQAFEILVEEMPDPMREEFALVVRENSMGMPLDECLDNLRKRMPIDDLGLITSAVSVARETGGNLTDIFAQLVITIRDKIKLERKVRALTVQGRLQGLIMCILPIAFALFVKQVNPESFDIMLNSPIGRKLLIWAACSEIIGIILIRKLSKVEV